ncbi:MAG TPA: DUF4112 domain-containing protein [Isosphaeraceae bacterium]|jgi:hypothetical protein
MAPSRLAPRPLRPDPQSRSDATARLLEQVAWLMDRVVTVPGTKISFGLDALLGLFPGLGDVLTGVIQVGLVLVALKHYRVPKAVAARMVANVLLDTGLGSIPLVGDLFDVAFKANTRNLQLLHQVQEHQEKGEPVPSAPSVAYLLLIGGMLGGTLVLLLVGVIALIAWLIHRPLI